MLLQVPDLGPESPQVPLQVDEAGIATWHFPEPPTAMAPARWSSVSPGGRLGPDRGRRRQPWSGGADRAQTAVSAGLPGPGEGVGLLARVLAAKYERPRARIVCAHSLPARLVPQGQATSPTTVGTASTDGHCCSSTALSPRATGRSPVCPTT